MTRKSKVGITFGALGSVGSIILAIIGAINVRPTIVKLISVPEQIERVDVRIGSLEKEVSDLKTALLRKQIVSDVGSPSIRKTSVVIDQ